jgi:hypothetical protein
MLGDKIMVCSGTPTAIDIITDNKIPTKPDASRLPPPSSWMSTELLIVSTNRCTFKKINVTIIANRKQMTQGEIASQ